MKINSFFNIKFKTTTAEDRLQENTVKAKGGQTLQGETVSSSIKARTLIQSAGLQDKPVLETAVQLVRKNGTDPSSKSIREMNAFLDNQSGDDSAKLKTIEIASSKGIELTEKNLSAVHAALNDPAVDAESLNTLMPEVAAASEAVATSEHVENSKGNPAEALEKGAYTALKEALIKSGMEASKAEALVQKIQVTLKTSDNPIEALQTLSAELPEHSNLKSIIETSIEQLSNHDGHMSSAWHLNDLVKVMMAAEQLNEVNQMLSKASNPVLDKLLSKLMETTQSTGNTLAGLGQTAAVETLSRLNVESGTLLAPQQESTAPFIPESSDYDPFIEASTEESTDPLDDFLEQMDQLVEATLAQTISAYGQVDPTMYFSNDTTKAFLVKSVTAPMIEIKQTFNQFKDNALKQLDPIINQSGLMIPNRQQMSLAVSNVAERLDHLIMNTDLTLYTDMKSEKKLISLSSQLQQVAQLAQKEPQKAMLQLKDIHKKIEALTFNPSRDRVEVHAAQSIETIQKNSSAYDKNHDLSHEKTAGITGAKPLLELMRSLGLNHEPELLESMMTSKKEDSVFLQEKDNLKQMLLKLEADAESDPKTVKALEKSLLNLTGQQLLNKQDADKNSQTMFFNLPINADQEAKIYIKSRNKNNGLDWENCTAFVLVDTKAYGMVGVRLNITDRHLNMSISSKSNQLEEDIKPYAQRLLADLRDIGYYPNPVKFLQEDQTQSGEQVLLNQDLSNDVKAIDADPAESGRFEVRI